MSAAPPLTFFHSPNTRSGGTLIMLEELGAKEGTDYTLHLLNQKAGQQRQPAYLAVNPMGKVPAILHGSTLVTEQAAVYMYLAELFPKAGLAPQIGDTLRGAYLRWMVFYGSCCEPAVVDRAQKHPPVPPSMCPYGDFDTMLGTVTGQLAQGPYLLGEKFTAADVLWGTALSWITMFKLIPELPVIKAYVDRVNARPAVMRARAKDAELAASFS
jgi:glutathione S-transferase